MSVDRIEFQGTEYLLIDGGAIAPEEDFINGLPSFAHLHPDGKIRQQGFVIGFIEDIKTTEIDTGIEMGADAAENVFDWLFAEMGL